VDLTKGKVELRNSQRNNIEYKGENTFGGVKEQDMNVSPDSYI